MRDDRIYDLEEELKKMAEYIASLEKKILDLEAQLLKAPEVRRIAEAERTRVIYKEDPRIKKRNEDLQNEIDGMMLAQQTAELRAKNAKSEYEILQEKYRELEEILKNPRVVYIKKEVPTRVEVKQRIGDSVEKFLDMFERNKKRLIKELMFAVLFYQARYKKYFRENLRSNPQKIMIFFR